jgi:hypothetical protein
MHFGNHALLARRRLRRRAGRYFGDFNSQTLGQLPRADVAFEKLNQNAPLLI